MFSSAQAAALTKAPDWATLMSTLESGDLTAGASRRVHGLIPSRHLGGPELIRGPWQTPAMRAAVVFQCSTGFSRTCGAVAYTLRELASPFPFLRDIINQWKNGFDWTTYVFSCVNMACTLSVAGSNVPTRLALESDLTIYQIFIRTKDTFIAIYRAKNNHADPFVAPALNVFESFMGVFMIVTYCYCLSLEVKEAPPVGATADLWNGIVATKFSQNGTSSIYRTTSLATMSKGNLKVATQIVRGALLDIRALANIARAGMEIDVAFAKV
jgi:hypothetical protein